MKVSKTKVWSVISGIGALATIAVQTNSGAMSWAEAIPAAVAVISAVLAALRLRDAVKKIEPVK